MKFLHIGVFLALLLGLSHGGPVCAAEFSAVFVDSRLLALFHPLFSTFNPETRRFRHSFSDPTLVREIGHAGVEQKITDLEAALKKLEAESVKKLALMKGKLREEFETRFLQEKKPLQEQLRQLRGQKFFVKDIPGFQPFTEVRTIIPEVYRIANDLRQVFRRLSQKHPGIPVIDAAALLPAGPEPLDTRLLLSGQKTCSPAARADLSQKARVRAWLHEAKAYWSNRDGQPQVIPFGAKDCREESLEILHQTTRGEK
jgi:hypothetical protein